MISEKELVLLGMLFEKPMYGYEIEKQINETSMREWTEIAFSSIYYLLKRLESNGYITSAIKINEKGQNRKIYTLTSKGKEEAKLKVQEIVSSREKLIWRIDLGIAYLNLLTKDEIIECLNKYEKTIDDLILGYNNLYDHLISNKCDYNLLELANRPLYLLRAEKEWIQALLNKIEKSD